MEEYDINPIKNETFKTFVAAFLIFAAVAGAFFIIYGIKFP